MAVELTFKGSGLGSPFGPPPGFPVPVDMPSALGWSGPSFSATVQEQPGSLRSVAVCSVTPKAVFDTYSTARSAPANTYYVDPAGSDAAAGSLAAPFRTIYRAVQAANTAGTPTTIFVQTGLYERVNNGFYGGGSNVYPTVDIALIAKNGRVVTGTFDQFSAPSLDGTQTNCYAITVSNCERVHDLANRNRHGNYVDLVQVATPAIANVTPGSWCLSGGVLYIRRADGAPVTNANTRLFRSSSLAGFGVRATATPPNIYIGGREGNSGFDFEGGTEGAATFTLNGAGTAARALVIENCSFKYAGGYTSTTGRSLTVESWRGITYLSNCRADAGWTDGFNFHNANTSVDCNALTVNCSATDNGRGTSQSCNGWTTHENVIGIDLSGYYVGNRGGTCRSINTSKSWLAGTAVVDDLGDGTIIPTAFRTDDTAEYWLDRVRASMPAGTVSWGTYSAGAKVHVRNSFAAGLASDQLLGTIDTY